MVVKIGFVKLGCIGSSVLLDLLLDERAERQDIEVRVASAGAKMAAGSAEEVALKAKEFESDFYVVTSPNASLPGPTKAREVLAATGKHVIVVSDGPAEKISADLAKKGFGYIIVHADSMIGARREFLDPVEMAIFNSDMIKVLSITGVYNILYREIDRIIESLKANLPVSPCAVIVDKENAVSAAGFQNPYARAKAMAAFEIARNVSKVTTEGCFKVQERDRYVTIVASAHEMLRTASKLAEEAREIEKSNDAVLRRPHYDDGAQLEKRRLMEKPVKPSTQSQQPFT